MMWKDKYRLGVAQIDQQHRALFDMTEELVRAVKQGAAAADYEKALGFLQAYVVEHFRDEEAYMASLQCKVSGRPSGRAPGLYQEGGGLWTAFEGEWL